MTLSASIGMVIVYEPASRVPCAARPWIGVVSAASHSRCKARAGVYLAAPSECARDRTDRLRSPASTASRTDNRSADKTVTDAWKLDVAQTDHAPGGAKLEQGPTWDAQAARTEPDDRQASGAAGVEVLASEVVTPRSADPQERGGLAHRQQHREAFRCTDQIDRRHR